MTAPPLDLPALQRVVAEAPPCTLVATCDDAHYPDACWYARIRLEHARGLTVATLQPDWCEGPDGTRHELTRAQAQALATYIATFDPATVGALLGEVVGLRNVNDELCGDLTRVENERDAAVEVAHDAVAERESLKEKLAAEAAELARANSIAAHRLDMLQSMDRKAAEFERELARLRRVEAAAIQYRARHDAFLDDDSNENMDAMDAAEADLFAALTGEPPARSGEG